MAQSDHIVEIIIQTNDQTGGALGKVQNSLLALDRAVQKTQERLKRAFSNAYSATIKLIDQVTPAGSKVNDFLKRLAGKTYNLALRLTDGATNGIRNLEAKLMRLAGKTYTVAVNLKDNATQKVKGIADGALMGMGGMGAGMLGAAGIGYGAVNAVNAYMDFEKQMSKVRAIAGYDKDDERYLALVEKAKEMGATTAFTREQAGQGLEKMMMAGWDSQTATAALPAVLNLAAAGSADLGTTSDILTDAMTGFQIKATEKIIESGDIPDAIICANDIMAINKRKYRDSNDGANF